MYNNKTAIMCILNLTPDSFYDGGKYLDKNNLINRFNDFKYADIIDVGCESSRPNSYPVSEKEELERLSLFIDNIEHLNIKNNILLSIDSYKRNIIKFSLKNGFNIINDISGGGKSFENIELAIEYNVPIVIMHMQGLPQNMQNNPSYDNIIDDIKLFFEKRIDFAIKNGLDEKNIILDPGIGFGKTIKDNDNIILNLKKFKELGFDLLIGISRKSFLSLEEKGPENNLYSSLGLLGVAIINGADIIRVHDVSESKQVTSIIDRMKYIK